MTKHYTQILGIIGGGQLGRMTVEAAHRLGIKCHVLDPDPNCCCKGVCDDLTTGSFLDAETVFNFGKHCRWVTVEFEHVSSEGLRLLKKHGIGVFPDPDHLDLIKDKGTQKEFYRQAELETAPFEQIEGKNDLRRFTSFFPAVQKTRTQGYDGKGVYMIHSEKDVENAFDTPSVLEKKADILQEFSIIGARNVSGDIQVFPASDLFAHPETHLLNYLHTPSLLPKDLLKKAETMVVTLLEKLNYTGLLCVEFFANKDGSVWINECAPRPHNSGHHTIEACTVSQFEQFVRAVTNLPLISASGCKASTMINILGPNTSKDIDALYLALSKPQVHLHLYGKTVKPWRKLGHVTILAEKDTELVKQIQSYLLNWRRS